LRLRQHRLVVVGVRVDEAGRDDAAGGVDRLFGCVACEVADGGNAAVDDAYVGVEARRLGAVDDGAAADQQVVVGDWLVHFCPFSFSGDVVCLLSFLALLFRARAQATGYSPPRMSPASLLLYFAAGSTRCPEHVDALLVTAVQPRL
jgi:hypothetical protein